MLRNFVLLRLLSQYLLNNIYFCSQSLPCRSVTAISFAFFKTYCHRSACLCMIQRKFGILHSSSFTHLDSVTKIRSTFFLWFEADQSYLEIDESVAMDFILIMHTSLLNYTRYDPGLYMDKFQSDKWSRLQVPHTKRRGIPETAGNHMQFLSCAAISL
jgi:hypothetical protein